MGLPKRIFVHYLDHEVIDLVGLASRAETPEIQAEFDRLLRVALLFAEKVLVPAASYYGTGHGRELIERFAPFMEAGMLSLTAGTGSVDEYIAEKQEQYGTDRERYPHYFSRHAINPRIEDSWTVKLSSTTLDIGDGWRRSLARSDEIQRLLKGGTKGFERIELTLDRVPELLGAAAFVAEFAAAALERELRLQRSLTSEQRRLLNVVITREYIRSYADGLDAGLQIDLGLFETTPVVPVGADTVSAARIALLLRHVGVYDLLMSCKPTELLDVRSSLCWEGMIADAATRVTGPSAWLQSEILALGRGRSGSGPDLESTRPPGAVEELVYAYLDAVEPGRAGIIMRDLHFHGDVTIEGDMVVVEGDQVNVKNESIADVLPAIAQALRQALREGDLESVLDALEPAVQGRADVTPEAIATAVDGELSHGDRLRLAAQQVALEASSGVIAQGLVLAIAAGV